MEQCIVGPKKYCCVCTIYLEIKVLQFWWLADSYSVGLLTHSKFHFADDIAVQFVQGQYNLHTSDMRSGPQVWTDI